MPGLSSRGISWGQATLKTEKMEKQEKELTKKEVKLQDFMEAKRLTVLGWKSIMELNVELGLPIAVKEMASIEVRTGMVATPFIKVDRFVDGKLVYRDDLVITGISESMLKQMPKKVY